MKPYSLEQAARDLLAYHEARMVKAEKREEHYRSPRHEDREEAIAADRDWRESQQVVQVLRHLLQLETDPNCAHLFPAPK